MRLTLSGDQKYRLWVPWGRFSPRLVEAVLLSEDRHFRRHPGVNPFALARAAWRTYAGGKRRYGGSTLTMQLARIRFRLDTRSPAGKLRQALAATQLERHYSKDEILEAYLNLAPYGGNIEGAAAASLAYFGKEPDKLALAEALTLAVIPQHPALRAGARAEADERASLLAARGRLFSAWLRRRPADAALGSSVLSAPPPRARELPFLAPHFTASVLREHPGGGSLRSTLDLKVQRLLERQLRAYVERRKGDGIANAAALLLHHPSMELRAAVGSADFFDASISGQVDGTRAKRSPGSALKPFIYGLGFDQGVAHPLSVLKDAPTSFGGYDPENFDRDFAGPVAAREALIRSRNVPAVAVATQLSSPTLHGFLKGAGVSGLRGEAHYGLSLALGSAEVTLEELARLYALVPGGGVPRPLRYALERDGAPLEPPWQPAEARRLLSPEASFLLLDILESNPRPGPAIRREWVRDALPVAWKTGTSFAFRDAWSVGIMGPYVLAVWVGNFDGTPNPAFVGVEAAAPLMFAMLDALRAEGRALERPLIAAPLNLARVSICPTSGMLPGPDCPSPVKGLFIPGVSPIRSCEVHRRVLVSGATGLRACREGSGTRSEVAEFWPTDLLKLFRQAGLPRRLPPADDPSCGLDARSRGGLPPRITSPRGGLVYTLRSSTPERAELALTASADADSRELHWFAGEAYLGRVSAGQALPWRPPPGKTVVRVVDGQGRSDAREVEVASW